MLQDKDLVRVQLGNEERIGEIMDVHTDGTTGEAIAYGVRFEDGSEGYFSADTPMEVMKKSKK